MIKTKKDLAERLKVSPVTVSRWFSTAHRPVKHCLGLELLTGIPIKTWITGTRAEITAAWEKYLELVAEMVDANQG